MAKRMYLVALQRKNVLVEAASQEAAVREATKKMVKAVTIPTPLEVARMMRDGVEVISESIPPAVEPPAEGGVGRLGLADSEPPAGGEQDG